MKLPLNNKKKLKNDGSSTELKYSFEDKFEQRLPIPATVIKIHYTLICNHGRSGETYAAKLAEEAGGSVSYMKTPDKNYMIKVITEPLHNADENSVKELLNKIAENGMKYNCVLYDWEYISANS